MTFLVAFLLALGESAPGLGFLLPGELAITGIATGVRGPWHLGGLVLAVTGGAALGDHIGFLLGRRHGARLASSRLVQRVGVDRWQQATSRVQRYGTVAILVSRMLPLARTVTPAAAGLSGVGSFKFSLASVLGCAAWATFWVTAGAAIRALGLLDVLWYVVPAAVVGALLLFASRFRSRRRATQRSSAESRAEVRGVASESPASGAEEGSSPREVLESSPCSW